MSYYDELESVMTSMRTVHGGSPTDYSLYQRVTGSVGDTRLLGPYGIRADEWKTLTAQAGIEGARWQDRQAQNAVVRQQLTRLYNQYGGKWDLVAVAWKAGEGVATRIANGETISDVVAGEGVMTLQGWVNDVMSTAQVVPSAAKAEKRTQGAISGVNEDTPLEDRRTPFESAALTMGPFANAGLVQEGPSNVQTTVTPERAIADVLTALRNKQVSGMEVSDNVETGEQRVTSNGTPEATE